MRRSRLILLFLFCSRAAHAQWLASADLGMSRLRQGALPEANAATFGATLDRVDGYTVLRASALGSRATGDRWTGQGLALASAFTPAWHAMSLQLTGAAGAFSQSYTLPLTSADASLQARLSLGTAAFSLGGGVGRIQQGGASDTRGAFDAAASWYRDVPGYSLTAALGWRAQNNMAGSTWHVVDATAWLTPHAGVNVTLGRSVDDVVRGVPSARYLTAALRLSSAPHLPAFRRAAMGPSATVARLSSDVVRIDITGVDASRVEVMADFTDWQPVAMERAGNAWRVERSVAAGLHRVAIRLDGGEWTVPRNLARTTDDLVGLVGLVTVP